jgi:3-phosphoshikimate 1-carboxyvinyltransferase
MTIGMLETFGGMVDTTQDGRFVVLPQTTRPANVEIEGDYSSASYLFAAAAIVGGRVTVRGLSPDSAQPDARFLHDLGSLGCTVAVDGEGVVIEGSGSFPAFAWDLEDAPDLAPTAAVLALFADGPSTLSGLKHLALKESDRMSVLRDNLTRLGARVSVTGGELSVFPPARGAMRAGTIRVAGDHRIAMAFAVAGLARSGIVIDDPSVVTKSYPRFWGDFAALLRTGS